MSRFPEDLLGRARDIHSEIPRWRFRIDRIGGVGIAIPVALGDLKVVGRASVLVGLPGERRGVDLSRENEALLTMAGHPPERIVVGAIERMVERLPYATSLEVRLRFTALMDGEPYDVRMFSRRESDRLVSGTSVRVVGATACPCSQELIRTFLRSRKRREVSDLVGTHTQRSVGLLKIVVEGEPPSHLRMARIIEEAMSSPTRTLLKRPEEATLVMQMIENPKLTEDVLRDILAGVVREFRELKNALVFACVRSMESVHKHDLYAERKATIRDLLEEVGG